MEPINNKLSKEENGIISIYKMIMERLVCQFFSPDIYDNMVKYYDMKFGYKDKDYPSVMPEDVNKKRINYFSSSIEQGKSGYETSVNEYNRSVDFGIAECVRKANMVFILLPSLFDKTWLGGFKLDLKLMEVKTKLRLYLVGNTRHTFIIATTGGKMEIGKIPSNKKMLTLTDTCLILDPWVAAVYRYRYDENKRLYEISLLNGVNPVVTNSHDMALCVVAGMILLSKDEKGVEYPAIECTSSWNENMDDKYKVIGGDQKEIETVNEERKKFSSFLVGKIDKSMISKYEFSNKIDVFELWKNISTRKDFLLKQNQEEEKKKVAINLQLQPHQLPPQHQPPPYLFQNEDLLGLNQPQQPVSNPHQQEDLWIFQENEEKKKEEENKKHNLKRAEKNKLPLEDRATNAINQRRYNFRKELSIVNPDKQEVVKKLIESGNKSKVWPPFIGSRIVGKTGKVTFLPEKNHLTDHKKHMLQLIDKINNNEIRHDSVIALERKEAGENLGMNDVKTLAAVLEYNSDDKNPNKIILPSGVVQKTHQFIGMQCYTTQQKNVALKY